jgi:arylsulfatase A-like enzyme/Flp pilus assembly protein TadD
MQPRKHEGTKKNGFILRTFASSWSRLIGILVLAAAIGLAAFLIRRPRAQADLHPIPGQNVLLITIDTLRADALGAYGGPAATPALDRLAADGVRFDFAHAHAVVTLPSHASVLTGQYPFQHGLRDNLGYRLPPGARTAATLLKQAGYATAAFVAAFPLHSRFGLNQGFDVYDDRFGETRAPTEFVMPERPASAVVPLARQWIAEHGANGAGGAAGAGGARGKVKPWFVWVHLFDPHAPYRPPPPFDTEYAGRPYDGEVAATDAAVAPLLEDVRRSVRPTLVVVTADHGEALGDHGEQSHGLFAYESTLRVPLIISEVGGGVRRVDLPTSAPIAARGATGGRQADRDRAGELSSVLARHIDILPTILDAIGQTVPRDLPGRTLLPAAERRRRSSPQPSYFEAMSAMLNRGGAPLTGVLLERDKFIELPIPERYELASDPAERTNLAGRSAEKDRALAASLRAFNPAPPGQRRAEDPEAVARLRALGYVSGNAPAKARYTEADDPKQLVELDGAIHRAIEAFAARRVDEAVRIYQDVLTRRPDMTIAYRHLAFIEWQRGNARAAVDVLERAVRAGATQPALVAQLGAYLADTGRVAEAVRLLEPLAKDPDADADALNSLGIAYVRAGRRDEARRVFERVLELNPDGSVPLENLGMLALEQGDLANARRHFERAIAADPRSSRAHADLGVVAIRTGNRAAALEEWNRAVELDPMNYDALYNLGRTLAANGELTAARPYLEQFLRTAPPAFYAKDLKDVTALLRK